jgi:molybdenum cofactor synthesis domain-containing protein
MGGDGKVRAALIIIGNEILSGRTQDANLAFIAKELNGVGVTLAEVRVIPDDEGEIIETLNTLRARYTYVFTTGGIGPTHDDITAQCVAKAFGRPLIRNPEAAALIEARAKEMGREINEARLRMANTPEGAALIKNSISAAPGFQIENVYVLAGVPVVMQVMLAEVTPHLTGGSPTLSRAVTSRVSEGIMADGLSALQDQYPDIDMGSYPFYKPGGVFGTTIVMRHTDAAELDKAAEDVAALMRTQGGEPEFRDTADD